MDLRKRLARLDKLTRKAPAPEPVRPGPSGVSGGATTDREVAAILAEDLGLSARETPTGILWSRQEERYGVPRPGPVPDLTGIATHALPPDLVWDDVLLLDTETTGLAGGTGTLPFQIGLAWWAGDAFIVRQIFLDSPGREAPLLDDLAAIANRFRVVVTYNGASFDLPLLRTRARMNRRDSACDALVSLDLLPVARRLWGRGLPNCRQQTIERAVCGRERGPGDIPGELIPASYQGFLRDGRSGVLPAVLRHNRRDMDGMGLVLAAAVDDAAEIEAGPGGAPVEWSSCWSRALVCERRRRTAAAAAWASELVDHLPENGDLPPAVYLDATRLLKRILRWDLAETTVNAGLARWPEDMRLHYQAAVLYEHRLGDPARALIHAETMADLHRIERLRSRLDRC